MLAPAEVKPLLLHENADVRWLALRYFVESHSRDAEVLPLALRAADLATDESDYRRLYHIEHLAVNDEAAEMLRERLNDPGCKDDHYYFLQALLAAPTDVLGRHIASLRSCPHVGRIVLGRMERRVSLASRPAEGLWQELLVAADVEIGELSEQARYRVDDYIHVLAEREGPFWIEVSSRLCDYLEFGRQWLNRSTAHDEEEDEGDDDEPSELRLGRYQPLALITLAGKGRRDETAPTLLELTNLDGDYLLEACDEALCRISNLESTRALAAKWGQLPEFVRFYLPSVLGAVKEPEGDEILLTALAQESDIGHRTALCGELCANFSRQGLDVVCRQIDAGYDPMVEDLVEDVLAMGQVLGVELPDADRWLKERAEQEANSFRASFQRKVAAMAKSMGVNLEDLGRTQHKSPPPPRIAQDLSPSEADWVPENTTIRNEGPRIGRNEPCPCGSGKKYKKCCGSRASLKFDDL